MFDDILEFCELGICEECVFKDLESREIVSGFVFKTCKNESLCRWVYEKGQLTPIGYSQEHGEKGDCGEKGVIDEPESS